MPIYFIASHQIHGETAKIDGPLLKHLRDVLRVNRGETLTFVDECRQRYVAQVDRVDRQALVARITSRLETAPPTPLQLTLAQGIIKGKKMDWIIQKATELGVGRIIPLHTSRTVVRLDGLRAQRQQTRWQTIAYEAAQQSSRDEVPQVQPICSFSDFIRADSHFLRLILWEGETERSLKNELASHSDLKSAALLIGPEGGFSQQEVSEAKAQGFRAIHLGQRILRTETASLVTLGVLQYLWGDLGS